MKIAILVAAVLLALPTAGLAADAAPGIAPVGRDDAQDYRARVQGTVSDTSQAVLPGVAVTLSNDATGVASTRVTVRSRAPSCSSRLTMDDNRSGLT